MAKRKGKNGMRLSLTQPVISMKEMERNKLSDETRMQLKQKYYLQDLCRNYYIKFKGIFKAVQHEKITQEEGKHQLFQYIFTLPENNSFDDKYLKVKCFFELLKRPKTVAENSKSTSQSKFSRINPWSPVFPTEIMKMVLSLLLILHR